MNGHSRGRPPARRLAVGVCVVPLLLVAGCTDDSTADRSSASTTTSASSTSPKLVSPAGFEQRIAIAGAVTINVHVPDEGNIAGTDLRIPYTEIATSTELPADRGTPLAVYCRSGNMSATAVRDLAALGYTDVIELDGGFNAWKESGSELQNP